MTRLRRRRHVATGTRSEAVFSACGAYRYGLTRTWDAALPRMVWIMLNPSTADHLRNDPTIERCERRARGMGMGAYRIVNLYGFRATRPADLFAAADPVGPDNDAAVRAACRWAARRGGPVVCGWGAHGGRQGRGAEMARRLGAAGVALSCLDLTAAGEPRHPLYVPYSVRPRPWPGPAAG